MTNSLSKSSCKWITTKLKNFTANFLPSSTIEANVLFIKATKRQPRIDIDLLVGIGDGMTNFGSTRAILSNLLCLRMARVQRQPTN